MFPPITESPTQSDVASSRVKRGALAVFRVVRVVQCVARSVPGALASVGHDVADAWRESARPNA